MDTPQPHLIGHGARLASRTARASQVLGSARALLRAARAPICASLVWTAPFLSAPCMAAPFLTAPFSTVGAHVAGSLSGSPGPGAPLGVHPGGGDPPEPTEPTKVMPLGDSITVGFGFAGGYRSFLQFELDKLPQPFAFVGSSTENPPPPIFDDEHEGHAGFRVRDLISFPGDQNNPPSTLEGWLDQGRPEAICLHIGTNDTASASEWQQADEDLAEVLDRIWLHKPGTWVVLAELIPTGDATRNLLVESYNRRVRELFVQRYFAGDLVRWVDLYPLGFKSGDGGLLHPSAEIYADIGRAIFEGVRQIGLPALLPEPSEPVLAQATATASDFETGFEPGAAFTSQALDQELHNSETDGAWLSMPFDTTGLIDEPLAPSGAAPYLELELDRLSNVAWIDVYGGRLDPASVGDSWPHIDQVRRFHVSTSPDGVLWTARPDLATRAVPNALMQPGERFDVDWPAVRFVRLEVAELQEQGVIDGPAGLRQAAVGEVRMGGVAIDFAGLPPQISVSGAGVQDLYLDAGPDHADETFLILGSSFGTSPGVPLSVGTLPLVPDAYLFLTATLGASPPLSTGLGLLDGSGRAQVTLTASPTWPADLIGAVVYHAYVTLDLTQGPSPELSFVSSAVGVRLVD